MSGTPQRRAPQLKPATEVTAATYKDDRQQHFNMTPTTQLVLGDKLMLLSSSSEYDDIAAAGQVDDEGGRRQTETQDAALQHLRMDDNDNAFINNM